MYCGEGRKLAETILDILTPYKDKYYHVFMDNYYNSVDINETLLKHKIRSCGTIRVNRGLPHELKNNRLQRGQSIFRRKGDVLLQIWQSKREVRMISNIHSSELLESSNTDWHTNTKIMKPKCVIEYNNYMKGVDRADQYLLYYSILRKTRKWTKRAVMYLLNCAFFNSYLVYNMHNNSSLTYKKYLLELSRCLITDKKTEDLELMDIEEPQPGTSNSAPRTPRYKIDPPGRLSLDIKKHKLIQIENKGRKLYAQRNCVVCAAHKKRKLTCFKCEFCNAPLHRGECYQHYHTHKKY